MYQYAVGTSSSTADVRSFPSGKNVDFEYSNYEAFKAGFSFSGFGLNGNSSENTDPIFSISKSNLPQGENLYVFVRAVNKQGKYSSIVASGPVMFDETAPESPSITTDLSNDGTSVTVTAGNLHDPESGIKKIEYKITGQVNGIYSIANWYTFKDVNTIFRDERSYNRTFNIQNYDPGTITIKIRVTNGTGRQAVSSKQITLSDLFSNAVNQDQNYNYNLNY